MNLQSQRLRKRRIKYAFAFMLLVTVEVLIALFVHDTFIRPYIGDVLVVMVLYTGIRVITPEGFNFLPLYLFIFAVVVELSQLFNIVEILGVENNRFLRILIGSVFDIKDIICYGIGCILLGIYEWNMRRQTRQ